jgi:hypothetical protein
MPNKPAEPPPRETQRELRETIWIVGYTAGDKAGILSRGVHFRSIHDSREEAERFAAAAAPDAVGEPTITEYARLGGH